MAQDGCRLDFGAPATETRVQCESFFPIAYFATWFTYSSSTNANWEKVLAPNQPHTLYIYLIQLVCLNVPVMRGLAPPRRTSLCGQLFPDNVYYANSCRLSCQPTFVTSIRFGLCIGHFHTFVIHAVHSYLFLLIHPLCFTPIYPKFTIRFCFPPVCPVLYRHSAAVLLVPETVLLGAP
jgi:hypothetical protein